MSGIFAAQSDQVLTKYRARVQFRDKIMGGVPQNPKVARGWIMTKMGLTNEEEIAMMVQQTMREMGTENLAENPEEQDIEKLAQALVDRAHTNGFKIDENGIYIEDRQIKACLKEVTNIQFAGKKWGATRKGPKNFLAERVFVNGLDEAHPDRIHLGRPDADGMDLFIGHVTGPQGPKSTLTQYQYALQAEITFEVKLTQHAAKELDGKWPELWIVAQEGGIGALRSQSHGRFDVMAWDHISGPKPKAKKVSSEEPKKAKKAAA